MELARYSTVEGARSGSGDGGAIVRLGSRAIDIGVWPSGASPSPPRRRPTLYEGGDATVTARLQGLDGCYARFACEMRTFE